MMKTHGSSFCTALAVVTALVFSSTNASANEKDVADFYDGKTIQILIGYSAGGGYDAYARTLARHFSKHMAGNPNVIAKNVPGAGSLVLMNQIANTLPQDGTVFGAVNSGMARNEGIMLPRGCTYYFHADESEPLVLLR